MHCKVERYLLSILVILNYTIILINSQGQKKHSVCSPYKTVPSSTSLECTAEKCIAICAANYEFPKGETRLDIECNNDTSWKIVGKENYQNSAALPGCQPTCSPVCMNNGKCLAPNKCQCTEDYMGKNCKEKACRQLPKTVNNSKMSCRESQCIIGCIHGYKFPSQATEMMVQCKNGNWVSVSKNLKFGRDSCEPFCYYKCVNGGECVAPNKCQCSPKFRGPQCQYASDRCSTRNVFGGNINFNCMSTDTHVNCSVDCPDGYRFEYQPAEVYSCKYSDNRFSPATMPKCIPENRNLRDSKNPVDSSSSSRYRCDQTCQNGGKCVFHNICKCPEEFAGDTCQYAVERCAPAKAGFNGGFSCMGDKNELTCVLTCPPGVKFDTTPAETYKCDFATGLFTPRNLPKCVYDEGATVITRTLHERDMDENGKFSCNPQCQNGGTCVFTNLCQCTKMFRGPQCQHSILNCDFKKTKFNGSYRCTASIKEMTCQVDCPPGVELDGPAAGVYTCQYETGQFYPAKLPQCLYGENVEIIQRSQKSDFY